MPHVITLKYALLPEDPATEITGKRKMQEMKQTKDHIVLLIILPWTYFHVRITGRHHIKQDYVGRILSFCFLILPVHCFYVLYICSS